MDKVDLKSGTNDTTTAFVCFALPPVAFAASILSGEQEHMKTVLKEWFPNFKFPKFRSPIHFN